MGQDTAGGTAGDTGEGVDGGMDGGMDGHGRDGRGAGTTVVEGVVLDEGADRLARACTGLRDAADGLGRLPVAAVATGSDAVLDALADLGRRWTVVLGAGAEEAGGLAAALRRASAAYAEAERAAADPLAGIFGWTGTSGPRTPEGVLETLREEGSVRDGQDGGPL